MEYTKAHEARPHILERLSRRLTSGIPSPSVQGQSATKPAPHGHAPHYSSHQIWQLVPVAKPCSALPLPWCNRMFSGVVTKINHDPPLFNPFLPVHTLYTLSQITKKLCAYIPLYK